MKLLKTITVLFVSVLIQLILFPIRLVVWILDVIEGLLRVIRTTLTFLIKQAISEVTKTSEDGKTNEKSRES